MNPVIEEANLVMKINDKIMCFLPVSDINTDPQAHLRLNPFYLEMRKEVHNLSKMNSNARRVHMRERYIQDFLQEDKELREVGLAYTES